MNDKTFKEDISPLFTSGSAEEEEQHEHKVKGLLDPEGERKRRREDREKLDALLVKITSLRPL